MAFHQGRHAEERAHERGALHAVTQCRVGGFLRRDLESVEQIGLYLLFLDRLLDRAGQRIPELFLGEVALHDENAVFLDSGKRTGMPADVRIGSQHDRNVLQLAVEAQRLGRQRGVERRGLAFLFRAVFRIGLNVEPEQIGGGHGNVLARGNRAPPSNRVHPNGDGIFGQEVQVTHGRQSQFRDVRVVLEHLLLPDLQLGINGAGPYEIDGQIELTQFLAALGHILHGCDQLSRLDIAASHTEGARVKLRYFRRRVRFETRERLRTVRAAILDGLAHCRPNLTHYG